jgi:hypothetical protein
MKAGMVSERGLRYQVKGLRFTVQGAGGTGKGLKKSSNRIYRINRILFFTERFS